MPDVKLDGVAKKFGDVVAVENVTIDIEDGEFVTLVGPSGCGKTTTLRMIAGLEKNTGGRIDIGETCVSDASQGMFLAPERRGIGMVFQSYAIWPHMTVLENVSYPLKMQRVGKAEREAEALRILDLVELGRYAHRPSTGLSGGQQQRVAIARALAARPRILLMDEPLSNLDAKLRDQMRLEIRGLQRRLGLTTIYVTHDQDEALALSDKVVVMGNGKVLQIGTPQDVYNRPQNTETARFFGSPTLFSATVKALSDSSDGESDLSVEIDGKTVGAKGPDSLRTGDRVKLLIRPEALVLSVGGETSDTFTLAGKVADRAYLGNSYDLVVRVDSHDVHLHVPPSNAPEIGSDIVLALREKAPWAIPV